MKHKKSKPNQIIKTISIPADIYKRIAVSATSKGLSFSAWMRTLAIREMADSK